MFQRNNRRRTTILAPEAVRQELEKLQTLLREMNDIIGSIEPNVKKQLEKWFADYRLINAHNLKTAFAAEKLEALEQKITDIITALQNDRNKDHNDTINSIGNIAEKLDQLRNDIVALNERQNVKSKNISAKRQAEMEVENLLEDTIARVQKGEPALDAVNFFLATDENRNRVLSLANRKIFKRNIYKKSIENMARAILEQDRDLFVNLNTDEYRKGIALTELGNPKNREATPTRTAYSDQYEHLSQRVANDILQYQSDPKAKTLDKTPAQIAFALDYWINVAYELAFNPEMPDLHGSSAVYAGMNTSAVSLVAKIILENDKLISKKTLEKFNALNGLFSTDSNSSMLRQYGHHPKAILSIAILQKDLEKASPTKLGKDPSPETSVGDRILADFQQHQVTTSSSHLPGTKQPPNIGSIGNNTQLHNNVLAMTKKDGHEVRRFVSRYSTKSIKAQLNNVEIKTPGTMIQAEPAPENLSEAVELYEHYPLRLGNEVQADKSRLYQKLQGIGASVITDKIKRGEALDLYDAAKDLCEQNHITDSYNKLLRTTPLIQAIALLHYIVCTEENEIHESASSWLKTFIEKLSPQDKTNLFEFVNDSELKSYYEKLTAHDVLVESTFKPTVETESAFSGHTKKQDKAGGANDAGVYGGVYQDNNTERLSLYKSEPKKEKVLGEYFAGRLIFNSLQQLHQDDAAYSEKFVGKVSLEMAKDLKNISTKPEDLLYLKSEFIENIGDFWTVAYALRDPRFKEHEESRPDERIKQLKALAKTIKDEYKNAKPAAWWASTLGTYTSAVIEIPSSFILQHDLLEQFCEMSAVRVLFGDFGVHTGNYVVIATPKGDDIQFTFGAIDFGAGFDGFPPEVLPFNFKESWLEYYKNHLLEYAPAVMKSAEMAEAFIKVGQLSSEFMQQQVNQIFSDEKNQFSLDTLIKFCARMKMPIENYQNINDKDKLLAAMRNFVAETATIRKDAMANIGYGLLIENCFVDNNGQFDAIAPLNQDLFNQYMKRYPQMSQYIDTWLQLYVPNRGVSMQKLLEVKGYNEQYKKMQTQRQTIVNQFEKLNTYIQEEIVEISELIKSRSADDTLPKKDYAGVHRGYLSLSMQYAHSLAALTLPGEHENQNIHAPTHELLAKFNELIESLTGVKNVDEPIKPSIPVQPKMQDAASPFVLTIAMLGTGEHREQGETLLTQFCKSIETSKNQSVHLIDGPAGKPIQKNTSHPMLGTYDVTHCERDAVTGEIKLLKEEKTKGACSAASGMAKGGGTADAIAEAMLVIETMLNDKPNDDAPLIINLAGFSRGADNTLRLANAIAEKYTRKEVVVNIFALDPVPGPARHDATKARLIPDVVQEYEAILMRNENRAAFKARDRRNVSVQDPTQTKLNYHLYHGVHSQGNYFYADPGIAVAANASKKELDAARQSEAARLVSDDLAQFAKRNHIKLNNAAGVLDYVQYRPNKITQGLRLSDTEKLAAYSRMLLASFGDQKNAPARDFTKHSEDYFLHGNDYFLDQTHMNLFRQQFPYLFDHLFQMGIEYQREGAAVRNKIENEMKMISIYPEYHDLLESIKDYPRQSTWFTDKNGAPGFNAPELPGGIPLIASSFYAPDNTLAQQWHLLNNALAPIFKQFDKSFSIQEANTLYKNALNILRAAEKDGEDYQQCEARKSAALAGMLQNIHEIKIQYSLRKKSGNVNETIINAVCAKLEKSLKKMKSYPSTYRDIVDTLKNTAKEIENKNLTQDSTLINQLLNDALHAINQSEGEYTAGSNKFKKAIRNCIIMAASAPIVEMTDDQHKNAESIHAVFANELSLKSSHFEMIEPPEAKAPDVTPAPEAFAFNAAEKNPATADIEASTQHIIEMLNAISATLTFEPRKPESKKPAAAEKTKQPVTADAAAFHRFFYRSPHDRTAPAFNPYDRPRFD